MRRSDDHRRPAAGRTVVGDAGRDEDEEVREALREVAAREAGPALVVLPQRAVGAYESMVSGLDKHLPGSAVCYAYKASYSPQILEALRSAGCGAEVMSDLELQLALGAGVAPERIVVNGLGRGRAFHRRAVDAGVGLHVVDTATDVTTLGSVLDERSATARVLVRVRVPVALHGLATGTAKLGTPWGSQQLEDLLSSVEADPRMSLVGLHVHSFTRLRDPAVYEAWVRRVVEVAVAYSRHGHRLEVLDLGGGLDSPSRLRPHTVGDFVESAARALAPLNGVTVVLEPGRHLVADAVVGLGTVVARKDLESSTWVGVDLASNVLIPVPGAVYPVLALDGERERDPSISVGDGTCTDTVIDPCGPVGLDVGDRVVVRECGAYTTVFAHVWGPDPAAVYVLRADGTVALTLSRDDLAEAFAITNGARVSFPA